MIEVRHLSKSFDGRVVLDDVSLRFQRGLTTSIVGPSGTGKSVLVKHLVGLLQPDCGELWIDGKQMVGAGRQQWQETRKRFGMLFQEGALFDSMSAGENIAYPLRYHERPAEDVVRQRVDATLELVDLPGVYDRPVSELSGGQRKRVALARAIIMQPDILFFDEPNSGLDPVTSDTIDELIIKMKEKLGITFVVITHDMFSAMRISDAIAMLHDGSVIESGSTQEFLASEHPIVRKFLTRHLGKQTP